MRWLAPSAALLVAILVGYHLGAARSAAPPPVTQASQVAAPASVAPPTCTAHVDQAELREAARELAPAPAPTAAAEPPTTATDPGAQAEALAAARALVATATTNHRWSPDDQLALAELIPRMIPSEREPLLSEVFGAINHGQLRFEPGR